MTLEADDRPKGKARDDQLAVLFRDDDLVAIHKPAGLPSVPAQARRGNALREVGRLLGLPHKGEADPRVRPLHRIDIDTSGLLVFALNVEAQRGVSEQFQNNRVRKEYLALVAPTPSQSEWEVDAPLVAEDNSNPPRMRVPKRGGKPAFTRFEVAERFRLFALVRALPRTGKTHQIRVHAAHAGYSLAVDPLYGHDRSAPGVRLSTFKRGYRGDRATERPLLGRLSLHAHRLTFAHPRTGEPLTLESPPPRDFAATLNMLRKYGR